MNDRLIEERVRMLSVLTGFKEFQETIEEYEKHLRESGDVFVTHYINRFPQKKEGTLNFL